MLWYGVLLAKKLSQFDPLVVKECNLNFDSNSDRTEEGPGRLGFPKFRNHKRVKGGVQSLSKIIDQHVPDIVHLQEMRKFTTIYGDHIDSLTPFKKMLEKKGYKVLVSPYNVHGERSYQFITAYNPYRFNLEGTKVFYLSKTPDKPTQHPDMTNKSEEEKALMLKKIQDHNLGELWERSTFLVKLRDKTNHALIQDFNVHLALPLNHKIPASHLMFQFIQQALKEHPDSKIIAAGDFNTFPNFGGPEQIKILEQDNVLKDAITDLKLANGTPVNTSFICYPYDFGENDERLTQDGTNAKLAKMSPKEFHQAVKELFMKDMYAFGSKDGFKLDHIFYHGFQKSTCALLPMPRFGEPKDYTEASIKHYIMDNFEKGPAFSSDHQPTLTVLWYA